MGDEISCRATNYGEFCYLVFVCISLGLLALWSVNDPSIGIDLGIEYDRNETNLLFLVNEKVILSSLAFFVFIHRFTCPKACATRMSDVAIAH